MRIRRGHAIMLECHDDNSILAKEQYAWAAKFRHHQRWGPAAQKMIQAADEIRRLMNEAPSRERRLAIMELDGKVYAEYCGILATLSQTVLDGRQRAPFQDEILRVFGMDVLLKIIGSAPLPPDVVDGLRWRMWCALWNMPPRPSRWRLAVRRLFG